MNLRPVGLAALLALLLLPRPVESRDEAPSAGELRGLVHELTELRTTASEVENRWREQQAHLETTLALYEEERKALADRLAALEARRQAARAERDALDERITAGEAVLGKVADAVEVAVDRVAAVADALPPSLRLTLAGGLDRLSEGRSDDPTGVADRLRLLNALSAELDRVLGAAHVVKDVIGSPDGAKREVDVLYLGGAIGYWVGPDDRQAGLLVRRDGAWTPVRRDDLAGEIREAIRIVEKEKPAAILRLPLPAEGAR